MQSFAYLSQDPLVFEPISSLNSVFFDPGNNQVFTLRARGAMGVNVKTLKTKETFNFRIQDLGEVLSIKFDPSCTIVSLQRKRNRIDFINFYNGCLEDIEYSQTAKKPSSNILGFVWIRECEVIFVTEDGFELYQISPKKHSVSLMKQGSVHTNWHTWDPANRILILASGEQGNKICLVQVDSLKQVVKLAGFEVNPAEILALKTGAVMLQQKNFLLANLYGQLYACILSTTMNGGFELALYRLVKSGAVVKTNVLVVPEQGKIAVNFVNNLVLVHHQQSKTSLAYDIAVKGEDVGNGMQRHYPILPPVALAEVTISCKSIPSLSLEPGTEFNTPLYASTWIVFPPNVVIDGSLGCLWTVDLNLNVFPDLISDPVVLVDCLANRIGGKPILRIFCRSLVDEAVKKLLEGTPGAFSDSCSFSGEGFLKQMNIFSRIFTRFVSSSKSTSSNSNEETIGQAYSQPFIFSLDDVNESFFTCLVSSENPQIQRFLSHLVIEYITVLRSHLHIVDNLLYEVLIGSLVKCGDYARLVFYAHSRLLADSKSIAFQLLSIESTFPPAGQLALDMLQRLGTAHEGILEILLAKNDPITALRFCRDNSQLLALPDTPRKCLDAAKQCEDPLIFYAVFRFFELYNRNLSASVSSVSSSILRDAKYQPYTNHFVSIFGPCSLLATI